MTHRRASDRPGEDHREERAVDPVLSERVSRLALDVEGLTGEVRAMRQDVQDIAVALARLEGVRDAETSGVRPSPLAATEPSPAHTLAQWVAGWSPWQVVAVVALVVGGPTVAGPAAERLLTATLGPPAVEVEVEPTAALPDLGESPQPAADTGPRLDTPAAPRPTL